MKHVYYGSADALECLNCGAEAGTFHYANCPCNDDEYDGDEPWDESDNGGEGGP